MYLFRYCGECGFFHFYLWGGLIIYLKKFFLLIIFCFILSLVLCQWELKNKDCYGLLNIVWYHTILWTFQRTKINNIFLDHQNMVSIPTSTHGNCAETCFKIWLTWRKKHFTSQLTRQIVRKQVSQEGVFPLGTTRMGLIQRKKYELYLRINFFVWLMKVLQYFITVILS